MITLLIILHVLVCFILIAVILLQAGRGQGLAGASFGSGNVQSLFGTKAADFLTKATSVAAICFMFTCLGLNFLEVRKSQSLFQSSKSGPPIDVDQIKKALEKVKKEAAEDAAKTAQTATDAVTAEKTAESTAEAVSQNAPVTEKANP